MATAKKKATSRKVTNPNDKGTPASKVVTKTSTKPTVVATTVAPVKDVKITKATIRGGVGNEKGVPLDHPILKDIEKNLSKAVKKTVAAKKAPAKKVAAKKTVKKTTKLVQPEAPVVKAQVIKQPVTPRHGVTFKGVQAPGQLAKELKKFPLVPIHSTDSQIMSSFSCTMACNVDHADGQEEVPSGFLTFNRSVDLMMLSCSDDWHRKGYTSSLDTISDDLKLMAIHASVDGVETRVRFNPEDHKFVSQDNTNVRHLDTVLVFELDKKRCIVQVKGKIDLITGRIFLHSHSTDEKVVALGYYLSGSRQHYV